MISFDPHRGVICYNKDQGRIVCEYYIKEYKATIGAQWDEDLDKYLDNYDNEEMPTVEVINVDNMLDACGRKEVINRAISFEDFITWTNKALNPYDFF